ncbi:MAG: DUF6737 family protein [Stenomitos frigidus ULC029]
MTFLKKPIAMSKAGNVWTYKPWWCQPWSILLTGAVLIGGSWGLLQTVWLTVLVAVPVVVWMVFFLLIYPRLMQESGTLPEAAPPSE